MGIELLKKEAADLATKMRGLVEASEKDGRSLTTDEFGDLDTWTKSLGDVQVKIAAFAAAQAQLDELDGGDLAIQLGTKSKDAPVSLGAQFLAGIDERAFKSLKAGNVRGVSTEPIEIKAATDTHTSALIPAGYATDVDKTPVRTHLRRPTIADWLLSGTLTGSSIKYFVENAALEGAVGTVGEGAKKPQIHHTGWTEVTESLKKVAGYIKVSTEMLDDTAFLVSEIEARLLAELALAEEILLLSGDGQGNNPLGLLNRAGVQVGTTTAANLIEDIFLASQEITLATGLVADGIVINPVDYAKIRLSKDANGQYYAGGPFTGQYGNGGLDSAVTLWGIPLIPTPAIAAGTVLVGASQAATVYSKGAFTLAATNTNEDDFVTNKVTILAEKRIALAVRRPLAFKKLTIAAA